MNSHRFTQVGSVWLKAPVVYGRAQIVVPYIWWLLLYIGCESALVCTCTWKQPKHCRAMQKLRRFACVTKAAQPSPHDSQFENGQL